MKKFKIDKFTGKDGNPAYIQYKGNVYDVTQSKLWAGGVHMGRHKAGEDMTDFMSMSPHGDEVLDGIDIVGDIAEEEDDIRMQVKMDLSEFYRKYHPHPILIHFPMGLIIFCAVMQSIFLISGGKSFEQAAFYSLVFATITAIPTVLSGLFSWWVNYDLTMTTIFKNKIGFSIILLILGLITVTLRIIYSGISSGDNYMAYIYNALLLVQAPVALILGYYGGKITWPS